MSARRPPFHLLPSLRRGLLFLLLFAPLAGPAHAAMIGAGPGSGPRSVQLRDLNEDGYADLVWGNYQDSTVCVALGRGNGQFDPRAAYPCGAITYGIDVADLNGDGHLDVVDANATLNKIQIRFGAGDGTLGPRTDYAAGGQAMNVVARDLNEDGLVDLAIATQTAPYLKILFATGAGTYGPLTEYAGASGIDLAVGDLNNDGDLDIVMGNASSNGVNVYLSSGGPGLYGSPVTYSTTGAGTGVLLADFNHDGALDIAAASSGFTCLNVRLGVGNGTFAANTVYALDASPFSASSGDFNGDGNPDIAVGVYGANEVSVFLGTGTGTFQPKVDYPAGLNPMRIAVGQLDGDANVDLAVASWGSNSICTLPGNGNGTFQVPSGQVYVWAPASGSAVDANAWLPPRNSGSASDVLVFNRGGAIAIGAVGTTSIGQFVISGGTEASFSGLFGSNNLTVAGGTGTDGMIERGSKMTLASGAFPLFVSIASGAFCQVDGDLEIRGGNNRVQAVDPSGIVFQSTGRAIIGPGSSTTPFGNGSGGGSGLNSVNFLYGSRFIAQTPISVFGATAPSAVVRLGPGSRFRQDVAFNTDVSGRTFGDFEYNVPDLGPPGMSALTGNLPLTIDSLIVSQGILSLESTGGGSIRGNIITGVCANSTALRVVPATPTTYHLDGTAPQLLRNTGGCFTVRVYASPNVTWDIDNPAGLLMAGAWYTSSNFNFTHGNINNVYTNGQLTADSTSTITGSSQSTGWVTSYFMRRVAAGGPMRMDVGDATHYLPVDLDIHGFNSPGYVTCGAMPYVAADIANAQLDLSHLVHRTWLVDASNNTGNNQAPTFFTTLDATFPFASSDVDPGSDPLQFVLRQSGWWNGYMWRATTTGTRTATSIQALGLTASSVDTLYWFSAGQPITPTLSVFNASSPEGNGSGVQVEPQRVESMAKIEPAALEPLDELGTPLPLRRERTRPMATVAAPLRVQSPGALSFRVRLSQTAIVPVSVDYQTVDSTATVADGDYTPTSGTLTFAPGDSALDIVVPFGTDSTPEHNETFGITLSNASNATIDTPTATGTIVDDDDLIAPSAQVIYPNGGEVIHQNQQVTLQWTASDNVGVNGVDVQLVNGASVTTLASNYPNTGSYDWLSTGPASTKMKFRVVAHDDNHATTDNSDANWQIDSYTIGVEDQLPVAFALAAPSPNPSAAGNNLIAFSVPKDAQVRLTIHDVRGRTVAKLVDGPLPAGNHTRIWDASAAAAGVYFVRFEAPHFHADRRLVVIR